MTKARIDNQKRVERRVEKIKQGKYLRVVLTRSKKVVYFL